MQNELATKANKAGGRLEFLPLASAIALNQVVNWDANGR